MILVSLLASKVLSCPINLCLRKRKRSVDGIAIAWAISEELIGLGAYALFATHFTALSELADLYPSAKLWHFSVDSSAQVRCFAHFKKLIMMLLQHLLFQDLLCCRGQPLEQQRVLHHSQEILQ